jgi:hypothetical protein
MQAVLDTYLEGYNHRRPHQGRGMNGRTPAQVFADGIRKSTTAGEDLSQKATTQTRRLNRLIGAALSGHYPLCTILPSAHPLKPLFFLFEVTQYLDGRLIPTPL